MFGSNAPSHCCNGCNSCQQQQQQQQQPGASASSRARQQRRGTCCGRDDAPCCSCQLPMAAPHRAGGRNSWPPVNGSAAASQQSQPPPPPPQPFASAAGSRDASGGGGAGCRWSGDDGFAPQPGRSCGLPACRPLCECGPPACAPLPADPAVSGRAGLAQQALMGLYGPPEHLRHHSGLVVRHPTEKKFGYIVPLCVCNCGQFVQGRNGVLLKCRSMLG